MHIEGFHRTVSIKVQGVLNRFDECFIAGIRAGILQLFDGASEIPNVFKKGFARTFVKTGNEDNAIKDFYATQPIYIQTYYFPFGVSLFHSCAKDNTSTYTTSTYNAP